VDVIDVSGSERRRHVYDSPLPGVKVRESSSDGSDTAFVLDVQSRRVRVIGSTPCPDKAFVIQCLRPIMSETGFLREGRILLRDRDPKWSGGFSSGSAA
jgi:hypothetical protein